MNIKIVTVALFFWYFQISIGQNNRLNTTNNIGWYNYFGTFKVAKSISIHTEYQFRRNKFLMERQQSLLRFGVNYQLNKKIQIRLGYAWIETFPYGEIPINGMGKDFTELRIFQMLTLTDKISIVDFSHRFMLEQRWVGRYSNPNLTIEDEFPFSSRLRYMFRFQIPLKGAETIDNTPYIALYNELFIGFGKNVNSNVFDQNRIGFLLGYRFNKNFRIEGGYLNQTLQYGRQIGSQNVFQNNNGFIINSNFNFDLTKK